MTMCGFSDVTIIKHTTKAEIEIKVSNITKQDVEQMSKYINDVKPPSIRVVITETDPEDDVSEHTYGTSAVTAESEMGTENIDINIGGSKSDDREKVKLENVSELFYTNHSKNERKQTLSDVKEKYVNGEISMLEFESQLEEVLDPEPIAID